MWQKIKCWYRRNFNIYKTWSFWSKSIHFVIRTGYNCESIIGIKYQYHRYEEFWNLWVFLWFADIGFVYFWGIKK